jgi:hypothetical protein
MIHAQRRGADSPPYTARFSERSFKSLPHALEHFATDVRPRANHYGVYQWRVILKRDVARHKHLAAADQPHLRDGMMGTRKGRVVTKAVRAPARPATRGRRVVSRASAPGFPAMLLPAVGRALLAER